MRYFIIIDLKQILLYSFVHFASIRLFIIDQTITYWFDIFYRRTQQTPPFFTFFYWLCFESFTCVFTIPVGHIWAVDFRCKWLLPLLRMKKFIYFPWNSSVTWIIFVFHYQRCYYFGLVLDFTSLPYFDCSIYYPV